MYPSFTSLSDRHEKQKSLIQRLELEQKLNKLQSDMYATADWNGQTLISLGGPKSSNTLSTQTTPMQTTPPAITTAALYDDLARLERTRGSSPSSVVSAVSAPTTKNEKTNVAPSNDFINELRSRILKPNLRPARKNTDASMASSSLNSAEFKDAEERLRMRMSSGESMSSGPDSNDSLLNIPLTNSVASNGSQATASTATTYLGTIGNVEQDDIAPTERDLSAKDSSDFVKALMDPTKVSGAFYERILKEDVIETKRLSKGTQIVDRMPFRPISKSTGKPLVKATWNPEKREWTNSAGEKANIDEIKTFIELWKTIKARFNGNPNALLRERNTLTKPMDQYAINILDSPPVSQGKGLKGGKIMRGRFNNLLYKTVGARKVHLPSLQKGFLSVRHMNGTMAGRKTKVDDQLLRLIKTFVFEDRIDQPLYDALDVDDQTIFSELLRATRIQNTLKDGWKNPKESLKARFDKLQGELELGNDSVLSELKKTLVDMFSQNMISDKQFKQLFEHLL